jgi:hypothetical protein
MKLEYTITPTYWWDANCAAGRRASRRPRVDGGLLSEECTMALSWNSNRLVSNSTKFAFAFAFGFGFGFV